MSLVSGGSHLHIAGGIREFGRASTNELAVVDGDRELTFGALDERSNRVANALLAAGLTTGDRVGVLLGNRLEYPEIAAGIAKAALVMVPVNPRLSASEVDYILGHSQAKALVLDDALAGSASNAIDQYDLQVLSIDGTEAGRDYESRLEAARATDPRVPVDETDPFAIAYTSGTTGKPKGVAISHRSRALTFYATALEWQLGPGSRTVAVAPMYHGAGFAFAYAGPFTGGMVAMLRSWDPEKALALTEQHRVNSLFLVPTHAAMMRAMGEDAIQNFDLSELSTLYFNAAALPFPLKEWVTETFPQAGVHELYGSTEASVVTCLRPTHQLTKPGSVGPPWLMTEVKLLDEDRQPVAPGEVGELFSRSPMLMNGYLEDDEATAAVTTEDGFVSAGDLARQDEDGFFYIVDRKKDMIITGGANVYPREVEDVLVKHPKIDQVAVIGTPSDVWGELVTAVVVPKSDAAPSTDELDELCRSALAGYKVPRRYEFVPELPASAAGKILKRELRQTLD